MKKIVAVLSIFTLAACIYAGNVNVLPFRNKIFSVWQTEKIFYYDTNQGEEFLSESKTITEDRIEKGQVLITKTGGVMASSKTFRTDFYGTETLRINKRGVMSSSYSPLYLEKDSNYEGFGQVNLNGETYMTVRQGNEGDILLVDGNGEIFNRIGRIVDGRLAILDITFFVEPSDVRLNPVVTTRSETTDVLSGYELIYNGVSSNYMRFTWVNLGTGASAEEFSFPAGQDTIEINGMRINVIDAGYNKIEYVIL